MHPPDVSQGYVSVRATRVLKRVSQLPQSRMTLVFTDLADHRPS